MQKIGVYLHLSGGGGIFQSLSMLDALIALPRDAYEVTAVYEDPSWQPYLKNITPVQLKTGIGRWWGTLCYRCLWLWNLGFWASSIKPRNILYVW